MVPSVCRVVTVTGCCCPIRQALPMACFLMASFSHGSMNTTCEPAVSVMPTEAVFVVIANTLVERSFWNCCMDLNL